VFHDILQYVVDKRAVAPLYSALRGALTWNDEKDERLVQLQKDPATGEPINRHIDIDFPSILSHTPESRVAAIIDAATLKGSAWANTIEPEVWLGWILAALGVDDADELLPDMLEYFNASQAAAAEQAKAQADALAKAQAAQMAAPVNAPTEDVPMEQMPEEPTEQPATEAAKPKPDELQLPDPDDDAAWEALEGASDKRLAD
jgi:hypothetical protein